VISSKEDLKVGKYLRGYKLTYDTDAKEKIFIDKPSYYVYGEIMLVGEEYFLVNIFDKNKVDNWHIYKIDDLPIIEMYSTDEDLILEEITKDEFMVECL